MKRDEALDAAQRLADRTQQVYIVFSGRGGYRFMSEARWNALPHRARSYERVSPAVPS